MTLFIRKADNLRIVIPNLKGNEPVGDIWLKRGFMIGCFDAKPFRFCILLASALHRALVTFAKTKLLLALGDQGSSNWLHQIRHSRQATASDCVDQNIVVLTLSWAPHHPNVELLDRQHLESRSYQSMEHRRLPRSRTEDYRLSFISSRLHLLSHYSYQR